MLLLAIRTSGVSSTILLLGRTTHFRFDKPLQITEITVTNISKKRNSAKFIRKAKVIIWDEAFLAKRQTVEIIV